MSWDPRWSRFYDARYAELFLEPAGNAADSVEQLWRLLRLGPGQRVLDVGSGVGRLALPLAARGVHVVGVDAVPEYVATAARRARALGVSAEFHAMPGECFRAAPRCHAGFCWWTSFGSGGSAEADAALLAAARRSLEPGAPFALDWPHFDHLRRHFEPLREQEVQTARGPVRVRRTSVLDEAKGVLRQRWEFSGAGQAAERETELPTYAPRVLGALFEAAGFEAVELWGEDEQPLGPHHGRVICVGRAGAGP